MEYQGMYAFPGTEPGQIIWTAWSGEEYVEALLKQLETGIAQKILVCLADGNCLKILQALIHKTLAQQSVSAADLAAVSGTDLEEVTDCLQRMEALELVTKKSLDNECAYSVKPSLVEGFGMMLAGLHAMRQPPVPGDADASPAMRRISTRLQA
ncbi:MAG: hypothetical protein ACI3XP_01175 [Eubacteriales bacterium]